MRGEQRKSGTAFIQVYGDGGMPVWENSRNNSVVDNRIAWPFPSANIWISNSKFLLKENQAGLPEKQFTRSRALRNMIFILKKYMYLRGYLVSLKTSEYWKFQGTIEECYVGGTTERTGK
jgi:hypothetical protein